MLKGIKMNANLFSYIENIGIERISQLFKYRNTLLLDDILIYAYVKDFPIASVTLFFWFTRLLLLQIST